MTNTLVMMEQSDSCAEQEAMLALEMTRYQSVVIGQNLDVEMRMGSLSSNDIEACERCPLESALVEGEMVCDQWEQAYMTSIVLFVGSGLLEQILHVMEHFLQVIMTADSARERDGCRVLWLDHLVCVWIAIGLISIHASC